MNKWENVIIHHSASEFGNARLIKEWHIERGWRDIGYHFVILNGRPYSNWRKPIVPLIGSIEMGRPFNDDEWVQNNEIGAHALGYNYNSIGVCLIHGTKFEEAQIEKLFELCYFLGDKFSIGINSFFGHYEKDKKKPDCPGFDMDKFRNGLLNSTYKKAFYYYLTSSGKLKKTCS